MTNSQIIELLSKLFDEDVERLHDYGSGDLVEAFRAGYNQGWEDYHRETGL